MPRRSRLVLPNIPMHIIQRGNNRQPCFFAEEDYLTYLDWLTEYAQQTRCKVHAYVLMTNHVHLLISADTSDGAGVLMKALGQRYVQYINRKYHRSGTLWEGRFRSCLVQEETYLLACQRYIELNPVRAKMVKQPEEYQWSSYHINALGKESALIQSHPLYAGLGDSKESRQAVYRELFNSELKPSFVDEIRQATHGNIVLGNQGFLEEIAKVLNRRVVHRKAGRPSKINMVCP